MHSRIWRCGGNEILHWWDTSQVLHLSCLSWDGTTDGSCFGAKLYIRTFKSNSLKSSFRLSGRFFCWKRKNCKSWCEERVKNSSFKLMPCDCEPLSHVLFFFSLQTLCVRREHILLSGNSKHLTGQWRPALVVVICPTFTGGGLFSKTIEGVR